MYNSLYQLYQQSDKVQALLDTLAEQNNFICQLKGLSGSSRLFPVLSLLKTKHGSHIFIASNKEEAQYLYSDLLSGLSEKELLFYPSSYKRSVQYQQTEPENIIMRTHVLEKLGDIKTKKLVIITYPEAIVEKVISKRKLKKNTLAINKGDNISIDFINEVLIEYNFERVDFVYEPGQYSIRGSIVDIYSFSSDLPYRIDFFGDDIESIRSFSPDTQLSVDTFETIKIIPNTQYFELEDVRETFFEYIPQDCILWFNDFDFCIARINEIYNSTQLNGVEEMPTPPPKTVLLTTGNQVKEISSRFSQINFSAYRNGTIPDKTFTFNTSAQPSFNKSFELLTENLNENTEKGYTNYIFSDNPKQIERLRLILTDIGANIKFTAVNESIHEGFIDHDLNICCYTDHQIFERYHRYKVKSNFSKKESITIKELNSLNPGDYVVHIDHGIGRFGGLDKVTVNGKVQEKIRLLYKDNDILYVSVHSLHRISKYKSKDGDAPKIYKLGGGAWQKLKQNTKKKVKDIARDLIALYAKRKEQKGFSFSVDSYLQTELEASFFYEDTPDQEGATIAVKADMEANTPMDRLICGDVGFGKTEIAIRAAFKAVVDNKQVAVLVPTTILALQHYQTFSERLKDFPCKVEYISRLRKPKEQKDILDKLAKGQIDILIGTHRLIGKDIKFKNLGLYIVDEEQKFGVSAKEKLRAIKVNVDTLTLTATPIPRTLQFSLMGARDLSIIRTPPPNRHPIITEIHTFNEDIIREGINYEVTRGGQVFFIHNRIQNIAEVEATIKRLCPNVKTVYAHGQMEGKTLEKIMLDFISGDYDVLIATTIIESGLDIPNANTIFINKAQNFGLSDLHQLRGRVGRSNKKAFCYLLAPPLSVLPDDSRRRLKAIEDFSELGSGFNIAMQDLDIRGAGNMLGGEQSGFVTELGFETYQRILDEALLELKENEYKDLFSTDIKKEKKQLYITDCNIDSDFELYLPESYITNVAERIRLYRELDNIETEEALNTFEQQLYDRFGEPPQSTRDLFVVVRLRRIAIKLGFEKIILKNNKMIIHFITNQTSAYYKSSLFMCIVQYVQEHPRLFTMKEERNKLTMTIPKIDSIQKAYKQMLALNESVQK